MATERLEREDKYDVPEDFVVPDLSDGFPGTVTSDSFQLEATYYDTPDDALRRQGITVRRRRGGRDAGWHLKLPAEAGRLELTVNSRASSPPREFTSMLTGIRGRKRLVRKATLSTTRCSHVVMDGDGRILAEVVDDLVNAAPLNGAGPATNWREIEVELGDDAGDGVLAQIGGVLLAAGAAPAASESKYARTMGPLPTFRRLTGLAGVVDDYLQVQHDAILRGDLGLRRDEHVVHPTRVAVRRLRSTVRVFGALFDPTQAEQLQTELAWYAGRLGAVRDLDVQTPRLAEQVASLPKEQVLGPVAAELESTLTADRADAWRKLRSTLNGQRYLALLTELERWRTDPPFTEAGGKKPHKVATYVAAAANQARKRLQKAAEQRTDDALFHRARKAVKRARYANELSEPVIGAKAGAAVDEAKDLQTLLGEHQDSIVSAALLLRLGARADTTPGQNGFTYGVLFAEQVRRAADLRDEVVRSCT